MMMIIIINENDVTMIIAGLCRYGYWQHVATGCTALVHSRLAEAARNGHTTMFVEFFVLKWLAQPHMKVF